MNLKRNPVVRFFGSLRLTVACLTLMFILTAWGTIYQTEFGLYAAQKRFFYSWFLFVFGLIPFPGAQLVMWVLSINLIVAAIPRLRYGLKQIGIVFIHAGLVVLLIGGFLTYKYAVESSLTLAENEEKNVSSDYREWELAVWEKPEGNERSVVAVDTSQLKVGETYTLPILPYEFTVDNYEVNSRPQQNTDLNTALVNASGFNSLAVQTRDHDPAQNFPGIILTLKTGENQKKTLLLHGLERYPTEVQVEDQVFGFSLRRMRYPLPFSLKLIDFVKDDHPGTTMASNFESNVELVTGDLRRTTRIYMNNPLRYKDYTLYQSSFSQQPGGPESTVLSVVKNKGRLFPYIACTIISSGLLIHFLVHLFRFINKSHLNQEKKT